jgi:hypothetical protein
MLRAFLMQLGNKSKLTGYKVIKVRSIEVPGTGTYLVLEELMM